MSEHTRTPWKVDKWLGSDQWLIAHDAGSKGRGIAIAETSPGTGKELANARHIVHCVNNHERLVEALERLSDVVDAGPEYKVSMAKERISAIEKARSLLAELEAGKGGEL